MLLCKNGAFYCGNLEKTIFPTGIAYCSLVARAKCVSLGLCTVVTKVFSVFNKMNATDKYSPLLFTHWDESIKKDVKGFRSVNTSDKKDHTHAEHRR